MADTAVAPVSEFKPLGDKDLQGMRKNGKQWHKPKCAFRPKAGKSSFVEREVVRKAMAATKEKERAMKEEKQAEKAKRVQAIKDRRAAKEEKTRYEKLAETMHKKRVERLRRKEKRNKMLKS